LDKKDFKDNSKLRGHMNEINQKIKKLGKELNNIIFDFNSNQNSNTNSKLAHSFNETTINLKHNFSKIEDALSELKTKLNIVVFGKVNSGKSSFINSLFGRYVALVDDSEWTYSINYITYGNFDKSTIYFNDGRTKTTSSSSINKILKQHKDDEVYKANINFVEFFIPFEELKDISVWDTPGLGSINYANQSKSKNFMEKADVVLWIMDSGKIGTADDKDHILRLTAFRKPIICIVNKMDKLEHDAKAVNEINEFINNLYPSIFKKIFFCSSLSNYDGKYNDGIDLIKKYLNDSIFKKENELIYASHLNNLLNLIQNIIDTLEAFQNNISERIKKITEFNNNVVNNINNEIKELKDYLEKYFQNYLFSEEYDRLIQELKNKGMNKQETETFIEKLFNEQNLKKYLVNVENITKIKLQEIFQNNINMSLAKVYEEEKRFSISYSKYFIDDLKIEDEISDVDNDVAVLLGPISMAISLLFGLPFFDALISGIIVFFSTNYSNFLKNDGTPKKSHIIKFNEYKQKIKQDYLDDGLFKRIDIAQKRILQTAHTRTCIRILNSTSIESNSKIVNQISDFILELEELSVVIKNQLSNLELPFIVNEVKDKNFTIKRSNPNHGIELLENYFNKATRYVYLVDRYFNEESLKWLNTIPEELSVKILLYDIDQRPGQSEKFYIKLNEIRNRRSGTVQVRILKYRNRDNTPLHSRHIFASNFAIDLDNSLDAIGRHDILVHVNSNHKELQKKFFDDYWNTNKVFFYNKNPEPVDKRDI